MALHSKVAAPGPGYGALTPNYLGARVPLVHSKLNIPAWRHLLADRDPLLLDLLQFGFPLGLQEDHVLQSSSRNHASAYADFRHVDKFLGKELEEGGLTGPFEAAPSPGTVVAPLMTAPKRPDSRRVVYDASFGTCSININTPKDSYLGSVPEYDFPSIDHWEELVVAAGPAALMWKRDLSRYYLQLPRDPTDYLRCSFIWRQQLYFFTGLMFGLRHAGLAAQQVTSAITARHREAGLTMGTCVPFTSVNYSDDLGGVEAGGGTRAWEAFYFMAGLLAELGLAEAPSKACAPSTDMVYLGVRFDTVRQEKSVPPDRLEEVTTLLESWRTKTKATKAQLQSLVGKLMWVAKVVRHSRPFVCRLLAELRRLHAAPQSAKVTLDSEVMKDITWWLTFLPNFNGVEFLLPPAPGAEYLSCWGDACPSGGGAHTAGEYWSRPFPALLRGLPIHLLEFWVLLASLHTWGEGWSGKRLLLYCDNDAVCDVLTYGRPKDPAMAELYREFAYRVCLYKLEPVVKKISSEDNKIADFLSRNHDVEKIRVFLEASDAHLRRVEASRHSFAHSAAW